MQCYTSTSSNIQVVRRPSPTAKDAIRADSRTSRYPCMARKDAMFANSDIMGDLNVVINLGAFTDYSETEF